MNVPGEALYLKQVSRVKHRILANYLVPWTNILGSSYRALGYVDCFAGGGMYQDEEGRLLPGSPLIALELAKGYSQKPGRSLLLGFVEKDHTTAERLRKTLTAHDVPESVKYFIEEEDAQNFVHRLVSSVKESRTGQIIQGSIADERCHGVCQEGFGQDFSWTTAQTIRRPPRPERAELAAS